MKKTLVRKNNLNQFIDKDNKVFIVDDSMIISPGVKDVLKEMDINIVYGKLDIRKKVNKKEEINENNKALIEKIVTIIKVDFNICDIDKISEITDTVLNRINT
ncbi:hypothetical protein [Dethiothermospora halolimnae]|uniref:hypothetical protein n=1 Tax=Dethiothermospora halolimnae TaxID=3114390 RepID=UPI003CCB810E